MNENMLLNLKIESKISAFGIRGSVKKKRGSFVSLSHGWVAKLRPRYLIYDCT